MVYIFLFVFWLGVALIPDFPKKESLKDRADIFLGRIKKRSEESFIAEEIKRFSAEQKRRKRLNELSENLAYIRNITVLGRGRSISTVYLLEEISDISPLLKKTYLDMAHALSLNDKQKACDIFAEALGEPYGCDIGNFLVSWEDISPELLMENIDSYVDAIRQERFTYLKRRDETISDLIYMPVVLNCMVVLMNFIYIAYFIEQRDALSLLF